MKYCIILFLSVLCSAPLLSERVKLILHSGEILIGEQLVEIESSQAEYRIKSKILGEIRIAADAVQSYTVLSKSPAPSSATVKMVEEREVVTEKAEAVVASDSVNPGKEKSAPLGLQQQAFSLFKSVEKLRAPKSWSGNLRMGMNFASGDRKYTQTYLRGRVKVEKEGSPHFFQLSGEYNFRETEQSSGLSYISDDRYDVEFIYRWLFSKHWFLQNASIIRMNNLKGIDQEVQNLSGFGYRAHFFDSVEVLLGTGVGMKRSLYRDVPDNSYLMVNVFQELNWKPSKKIKLHQKMNFFQDPENSTIYNYALVLSFNYRFTDLLGFEIRYTKDFDNGITEKFDESSRFQNALILYF
ncbi:MAG: hypothetical protein CML12_00955 [Puniceicoccaceae bacterium]|nr:hypothetical protein [Puniceicoccaceae bacterium]RCL31118.1 MAG: DUF481 domain-containing protein [Puniceicoccaceae bacterium]